MGPDRGRRAYDASALSAQKVPADNLFRLSALRLPNVTLAQIGPQSGAPGTLRGAMKNIQVSARKYMVGMMVNSTA